MAVFGILEEMLFPQQGYDMLHILNFKLVGVWILSFSILFVIGYFMARSVLKPVSNIVKQVENITASNLSERVEVENNKDEIGELATTFNKTLDRLEESFNAQKMFVSNVAHELRTPMSALIAELELSLHKVRSNEDYRNVVENALSDARNIEKLSNGLMDLAKASYDIDRIKMSSVRIDEVLLDASTMIMKANPSFKVELFFEDDTDDDNLITTYGNEYLLRTAFVNMMENNCKFSDNHSSKVNITFTMKEIVITFSDNGTGISESDIKQVFKPFFRGSNSKSVKGNGIGMTLVEKIISIHSGTIIINSAVNHGTDFIISLKHMS